MRVWMDGVKAAMSERDWTLERARVNAYDRHNIIIICNFYIAPTLYDTLMRCRSVFFSYRSY